MKLVRADLAALGVPENNYAGVNMPRTQEIGAAVEFLGCDGLIAPCARWACDNLMLFPDRMGIDQATYHQAQGARSCLAAGAISHVEAPSAMRRN